MVCPSPKTFDVSALASRHAGQLDELEEKHLDWTLETEMNEDIENEEKPNILSPFLPSQAETIKTLLGFIPDLDSSDCLIDLGCGDGRVLVGASQQTGCQGIGIDVSPDCILAAKSMMESEDLSNNASYLRFGSLSSRLKWICEDCTKKTTLLRDLVLGAASSAQHIYIYLYIYPTLLQVIRPQVEEIFRLVELNEGHINSNRSMVTILTAGYHFDDWAGGYEAIIAPRDEGGGANSSPVEIRKLLVPRPPH